jgi:small-conductance mechanosensitive channel
LIQGAVWGNGLYSFWRERLRRQKGEGDRAHLTTLTAIGFLFRLALWVTALLLVLANLGVNITALLAGLGVGGIAVALALQNILGDLFASMSILLDKPFVVGDFISVDNLGGTVEHIGLKTTRVRSLSGEQLVFSNGDLLKTRIRNYQKMKDRRVVFAFTVAASTAPEKLGAIAEIIRESIAGRRLAQFDRCYFKEFGTMGPTFESIYYVLSPDYGEYLDIQHAVNLEISRRFREEGIELAYLPQIVIPRAQD